MKLPRLREVRELHGWSQSRLAEESGVSRDSISNYETGHREAWPATAKRLADALGVEIEDLARPKVTAPSTSGQSETKTSAEEGHTKEYRLRVLRRLEETALEINRKVRADFESIEVATLKKPDPLIWLVGHAEWSYVGARNSVRNNEDVLEATSASPEERRAVDRVNTAINKLLVTAGDVAAALDSWAKSPVGTEDTTVTSLVEHVRRREVG